MGKVRHFRCSILYLAGFSFITRFLILLFFLFFFRAEVVDFNFSVVVALLVGLRMIACGSLHPPRWSQNDRLWESLHPPNPSYHLDFLIQNVKFIRVDDRCSSILIPIEAHPLLGLVSDLLHYRPGRRLVARAMSLTIVSFCSATGGVGIRLMGIGIT